MEEEVDELLRTHQEVEPGEKYIKMENHCEYAEEGGGAEAP